MMSEELEHRVDHVEQVKEGNMGVRTSVDLKLDRSAAFTAFVEELSAAPEPMASRLYFYEDHELV